MYKVLLSTFVFLFTIVLTSSANSTNNYYFHSTPPPAAVDTIYGDQSVCSGVTTTYKADSVDGATYQWVITNGTINGSSTDSMVSVTWKLGPDTGTVKLVINLLPISIDVLVGVINSSSVNPDSICAGLDSAQLDPEITGGSGNFSYNWSPTTGLNNSTIRNPKASPGTSTSYNLTISDGTCIALSGNDMVRVNVRDSLKIDTRTDTTICVEQSVVLSSLLSGGVSANYAFKWFQGAGLNNATISSPTAIPTATTTYGVEIKDLCSSPDTDYVMVTLRLPISVNVSDTQTICFGDTADLSASASGGLNVFTYSWIPTDSILDNSLALVEVFPSTSKYYYVTVSDGCSPDVMDSVYVVVNQLPQIDPNPLDNFICYGDSAFLGGAPTAFGVEPFTYLWSPGATLSATNVSSPTAKPVTNTTYYLTVTDSLGCIATDSTTLLVNDEILIDIGGDKFICFGDTAELGGAPTASGGIGTLIYVWNPAQELVDSEIPNPKASPLNTVTFDLTVQDNRGCIVTDTLNLVVNPLLISNVANDTLICFGDSAYLGTSTTASGGTNPYNYNWTPSSSLFSPNSFNPKSGAGITTKYYLQIMDDSLCSVSDSVTVFVNDTIFIDAGKDSFICFGNGLNLGSQPTAKGGSGNFSYNWNNESLLNDDELQNPQATPTISTQFIVQATDAIGCSIADSITISVNNEISIDAGSDVFICNGDSIGLGGAPTATGGFGSLSFLWSTSEGLSSTTTTNPKASPPSSKIYTLTVEDDTNCIVSDQIFVKVNSALTVNAGDNQFICFGDSTALGSGSFVLGGTEPYSYNWAPSTGVFNANNQNPKASPITQTKYYLSISDDSSCVSIDSMILDVNPEIFVSAGKDTSLCLGDSITLGGLTTGAGGVGTLSYSWTPSSGISNASLPNPKALPSSSTTYTVSVQDDNACIVSDQIAISLSNNLSVNAGRDTLLCFGDSLILGVPNGVSGGSGIVKDFWSPKTFLTDSNLSRPLAKPGITTLYTYTATDDSGCVVSQNVLISVNDTLEINAGKDTFICYGTGTTLGGMPTASGGTGDIDFSWSPSTGLNSTIQQNPIASPTSFTQYTLQITDENNCIATDKVEVAVNNEIEADGGLNKFICFGDSVQLGGFPTANGGFGTLQIAWSPNNGLTDATIDKPKASPKATTNYIVTVTDANDCFSSTNVLVEVNDSIGADAGIDGTLCFGIGKELGGSPTASGGNGEYSINWNPTDGLDDPSSPNPTSNPGIPINYILTITDGNNCFSKDTVYLTVGDTIIVDAGDDNILCSSDSVILGGVSPGTGGDGNLTFSWSPTQGLSNPLNGNPKASPELPTTYILTVKDQSNCMQSDTVFVNSNRPLDVNAGRDVEICFGEEITIGGDPTSKGGLRPFTYSWTPSVSLSDSTDENPVASPTATTKYFIVVNDDFGCVNLDSMVVRVNPVPTSSFTLNIDTAEVAETVTFDASTSTGSNIVYQWNFGDPISGLDNESTSQQPIHIYTVSGVYTIELIVTNDFSCSASSNKGIVIVNKPSSVVQNSKDIISIYPNPAKDQLYINFNSNGTLNYKLFSVRGNLLQEGITRGGELISVSQLNNGYYLLQLEDENFNTYNNSILIQK